MVLICPLEMVSGISHPLVKDRHLSMNLLLKKICVAFIISGLLLLEQAQACSRIAYVSSQGTIIARTMDLYMDDHAKMMIYPRGITTKSNFAGGLSWVSKYGSVAIRSLGAANSDGMNEKGFTANLLYLDGSEYEVRDQRLGVANIQLAQFMLDNFSTVSEALEGFKQIQVISAKASDREWPVHLSIADKNGDSAVIEFIKGKAVITRGPSTVVMTNEPPLSIQLENLKKYSGFGGKQYLPGDTDPSARFVRATAFLKTLPEPKTNEQALANLFGVAHTVFVPRGAGDSAGSGSTDIWPTLWATMADSKNGVYYFQSSSAPNLIWLSFKNVRFDKGSPVLELDVTNPSLAGNVSKKMKPL